MAEVKSTIEAVKGFQVAGVHAGLKKDGILDFALIVSDTPCTAAGVFTTNLVKAAPVLVDMERLQNHAHHIRAVAVNTKCANACTGQQGIDNALQTARWVAEHLGCDENEVLVLSTGVIGTQLPMDKIKHGIELAVDSLGANNWEAAARAIMTTDTRPKMASVDVDDYRIAGIAKGAGMIAPNMATMLGIVVTDGIITSDPGMMELLPGFFRATATTSFNRIVVDGDMSTNDTLFLLASGKSNVVIEPNINSEQHNWHNWTWKLGEVCEKLAKDIVRDGEGVTKFITVDVGGALDEDIAHQIANTIATSPLVKTAFYGNDANWGRIVAAAGRAGVPVNPDKMRLWIFPGEKSSRENSLLLFENGIPTKYSEEQATEIISQSSVGITLDCGMGGDAEATIWTCDLSHDYVSINGSYRS
ncbi:MAG: bifunctional glutamate N-acetyltransferase/amino-acid acetyltransferase ArgJ [Chloroflexota bacterium]